MRNRRRVLWQGLTTPSLERFVLDASGSGWALTGLILQAAKGVPYVVRYTIRVDERWCTREVEVELENGGQQRVHLSSDDDAHWMRDGRPLAELATCLDVDLEWSPSTNTLPIRRLAMPPGETRAVAAARIRFPSLEIQRGDQSYERLDQSRYRYRSGRFSADLEVDEAGIVLSYGAIWKAVA